MRLFLPKLKSQMSYGAANLVKVALTLFVLYSANSFASSPGIPEQQVRQLVQLAEYIAVDYVEAVDSGQVINEEEYQEMREFSAILIEKSRNLRYQFDSFQAVYQHAASLQQAIEYKDGISRIRQLSAEIRQALMTLLPASTLPKRVLPQGEVTALFQQNCTSCHGMSGEGDGPLASRLDPAPTDFTDQGRAINRSILGLYESISQGIDETSMPPFQQLSEQERWSLAFYVGSLAFQTTREPASQPDLSLEQLVFSTPAQLMTERVDQLAIEWLRTNPDRLMTNKTNPFALTKERLQAAYQAYQRSDRKTAHTLTVSAYLDGFELVENSLDIRNETLRRSIEENMMQLRQLVKRPETNEAFQETLQTTLRQLDDAERLLDNVTLSSPTLFSASMIILLREGLEALLVVIALMTVLIKSERQDALKYVHFGWLSAIAAGVATWIIAHSLITISGASREIMEGVAALLAAAVLLYVGIWMHSKTHVAHWQAYIQRHVNTRLKSGALWGLASLAFVAVYREVFETILFYQALLTQAVTSQHTVITGGFVLGVLILSVVAWLLIRFSVKLPISTFFALTTYLLLALSFVLIGKSITALQEAAVISASPLPVEFEINWIGVKSTWEGLLAQASVLGVFLIFLVGSRLKTKEAFGAG